MAHSRHAAETEDDRAPARRLPLEGPGALRIPPAPDGAHEPRRMHGHRPALSRALDRAEPSLARSALELRLPRAPDLVHPVRRACRPRRERRAKARVSATCRASAGESPSPSTVQTGPPAGTTLPGAPRSAAHTGQRMAAGTLAPAPMPTPPLKPPLEAEAECLQPAPAGGDMALEQAQPVSALVGIERGARPQVQLQDPIPLAIHQRVEAADPAQADSRQRRAPLTRKRSAGRPRPAPRHRHSRYGPVRRRVGPLLAGGETSWPRCRRPAPAPRRPALPLCADSRSRGSDPRPPRPADMPAARSCPALDQPAGQVVRWLGPRHPDAAGPRLRAAPQRRTGPWRAGSRPVPCPAAPCPAPGLPGDRDDARSPSRRRAGSAAGPALLPPPAGPRAGSANRFQPALARRRRPPRGCRDRQTHRGRSERSRRAGPIGPGPGR